jgi:hypothetical protein
MATEYGHYTSPGGLLGIIRDEFLWATNIKFLNDQHEFQHALKLIKTILDGTPPLAGGVSFQTLLHVFRDEVSKELGFIDPHTAESVFTISFSEETDLLSQWRGYCPGNNGYCIVFDLDEVHKHMSGKLTSCHLVKCVYDDAVKIAKLKELLNSRWQEYTKLRDAKPRKVVIDGFARELTLLASYFKHPSFKEEQEHRIVVIDQDEALRKSIEFREGRSSLVPYLKLPASRKLIKKIVIGPNVDQPLAVRALEAFVEKCTGIPSFIGSVEFVTSQTPYRRM